MKKIIFVVSSSGKVARSLRQIFQNQLLKGRIVVFWKIVRINVLREQIIR